MAFALFCPQCNSLLLAAGECAACGWRRPRVSARPGELAGEPVPIGRPLSGAPAPFEDVIWYAAPATSPDLPGALVALHRGGSLVRRHELDRLLGRKGQPVAHSVAGDGRFLYPGLTDYAFGDERPTKAILALEPRSGRLAWQVPTPSRELSTPVAAGGVLYATGSSENGVYAVDVAEARLRWQSGVEADHRFQPAVAGETVAALTGTLTGYRALHGLARQSGMLLWEVEVGPSAGQPVGYEGLVIVPRRQQIEAYDAASGSLRWQYGDTAARDVRETSRGLTTAPVVAAGELLLAPVGAWQGEVRAYALHALALGV